MSYKTIKELRATDEFEEKKSLFIGNVKRVENEAEARAFIDEIKSKHKQATHNCFAYVIGENMGIQRYSDDGEPQGTAGIPILEVMKKEKDELNKDNAKVGIDILGDRDCTKYMLSSDIEDFEKDVKKVIESKE